MRLRLSGKARRDLLDIYVYLAERNPAAANRMLEAINESFKRLSDFPYIGRERNQLAPGVRSLVIRSYLIIYLIRGNDIVIARVVDGRMDLNKIRL